MTRSKSVYCLLPLLLLTSCFKRFVSLIPQKTFNLSNRRHLSGLKLNAVDPAKVDTENFDVVVIGSGLAGLCCAATLAAKGIKVCVCESHYEIGGCAHEFFYSTAGKPIASDIIEPSMINNVYKFEAGPSLYSGLSSDRSPNPLKHVYQMIGEEPEWITYKIWKGFIPEAPEGFTQSIGATEFEEILARYGGPSAINDWRTLSQKLRPLTKGVMNLPSVAMRPDVGGILTLVLRYPLAILDVILQAKYLTRPFSEYYEELDTKDVFLKNYLNLLCFLLQGLPAEGTLSAVMAYMIEDFFKPNAVMDFPKGGSGAMAAALSRGITKHGGEIRTRTHIEEVIVEEGRAVGVRTRGGSELRAKVAVVSNCDMWNTYKLVPRGANAAFDEERDRLTGESSPAAVPMCKSFVHLHLGIDATGLPDNMPPQWTVCNDWNQPIDAPGNVIVVSMPSLLDPSLAPPGKHVIHAYTAGNEPYELWAQFKQNRTSPEYQKLKEERSECLWEAIAREIPDIKQRVHVQLVGTPLTHERYNRRYEGTYGPAIAAGKGTFPGHVTPLPGLLRCGDSTNPGIGVPAVAASGAMAAAAILPVWDHLDLLDRIKM